MVQDRVEDLKRQINITYKRYIKEITDEKATLIDVANFFNIPIVESRIKDYTIKDIDFNIPSIKIKDEKNDILYIATYTENAELLHFRGSKRFNRVISESPLRKEESLYIIGSKTPLITQMTIVQGEYELIFEREMPHSVGIFANDDVTMAVRYLQNMLYEGKNVKQPLLNKIYKKRYKGQEFDSTLEQRYTFGAQNYNKYGDTNDKYVYIKDNNVIYGINKLKQEGSCCYLWGVCFENTNIPLEDYLPYNISLNDYPKLNSHDTNSAIVFYIKTTDDRHHILEIYKGNYVINIKYYCEEYSQGKSGRIKNVTNGEYNLLNLSDGNITSMEIQNILSFLQPILKGKMVFEVLCNELNIFSKKMDINNGVLEEEVDPLSPKVLIDKSFDEIYDLVYENKEYYFKMINEQFEESAGINLNNQVRALKK